MPGKPAVEARLLLEDPRYEAYRLGLARLLDKAESALRSPRNDHPRMCRLAGEASALRAALALPYELAGMPTPPPGDES